MSRSRAELKGFFKKNSIPTQSNFEDLIDSGLNQNDDGLVKLPNDPLTISAIGTEEALLRFSRVDAAGTKPTWLVKQGPAGAPAAGLVFQDAASNANALFIQSGTGNVGVGTLAPGTRLDVAGAGGAHIDLNVNGRLCSNNNDGGLMISNDRFVGGAAGLVGFNYGNQWRLAVQSNGNVGVGTTTPAGRLAIFEPTGTAVTANTGTLLFEHGNAGGASSIVFRSAVNAGSDYGYIQYQDSAALGAAGESARLILGTANDSDDHLVLLPTGNVGVGTMNPTAKLEVAGGGGGSVDLVVNGRLRSNSNDGGLWVASDRFFGGFDTNKMGFWNNAVGWQFAMTWNGNVGIGNNNPQTRLHVGGDITASGRIVIGSWALETDGPHLYIKNGNSIVARFATTYDRFNVFQNVNGTGPYFYFNSVGVSGVGGNSPPP